MLCLSILCYWTSGYFHLLAAVGLQTQDSLAQPQGSLESRFGSRCRRKGHPSLSPPRGQLPQESPSVNPRVRMGGPGANPPVSHPRSTTSERVRTQDSGCSRSPTPEQSCVCPTWRRWPAMCRLGTRPRRPWCGTTCCGTSPRTSSQVGQAWPWGAGHAPQGASWCHEGRKPSYSEPPTVKERPCSRSVPKLTLDRPVRTVSHMKMPFP